MLVYWQTTRICMSDSVSLLTKLLLYNDLIDKLIIRTDYSMQILYAKQTTSSPHNSRIYSRYLHGDGNGMI